MVGFQGVEHRALGGRTLDLHLDDPSDARQDLQVPGQDHLDHLSVCTSTLSTAGRSRTIALHESPPSGET